MNNFFLNTSHGLSWKVSDCTVDISNYSSCSLHAFETKNIYFSGELNLGKTM